MENSVETLVAGIATTLAQAFAGVIAQAVKAEVEKLDARLTVLKSGDYLSDPKLNEQIEEVVVGIIKYNRDIEKFLDEMVESNVGYALDNIEVEVETTARLRK